ncbi:unnamed protein product [Prorocentrum cordatum]|uniref:Uncharacterized protein n=1 Tax=Prorocentrum cordatum TaxID=2364126 RepID=A0ABN9V892_9DINO|nr:unnamed protein product [Polarella glacialis]
MVCEETAPCPSPARADAGAEGRGGLCPPAWLAALIALGVWAAGARTDIMLAAASSCNLVPGDVIVVRCAADDFWHERVLCSLSVDSRGGVHWVVATPHGDLYVETVEGGSPEDSPVEWIRRAPDGRLPLRFLDTVRAFERDEVDEVPLVKCARKGATLALKDAKQRGEIPVSMTVARVPGGRKAPIGGLLGAGFVQPAFREGAHDSGETDGGDGNSLGYAAGQELKPVTTFIGCKGVYSPDGKEAAFVEFSDDDQADFVKRASARAPAEATPVQDARQLSIKYNPQGRVREWRDVVDSCQQEEFTDFPVSGTRSMSWRLHALRRRRAPRDHHLMFRSTCSLKPEQWGVAGHGTLLHIIELAEQYHQLNVSNMACTEAAARRIQTIDHRVGKASAVSAIRRRRVLKRQAVSDLANQRLAKKLERVGVDHATQPLEFGSLFLARHADVKDAFRHLELPHRRRDLLALPAAPAWIAGRSEAADLRASPGWVTIATEMASARDVEKDVGHCTSLALLCRASLSIFLSVYAFVARRRFRGAARLWESVMARRDFGAPRSSKATASDATFRVYGVVSRDLPPERVRRPGRVSERWRFSGKAQIRHRKGVAGPDGDLDSNDWAKEGRSSAVGARSALRSAVARGLAAGVVFASRRFPSERDRARRRAAAAPAGASESRPLASQRCDPAGDEGNLQARPRQSGRLDVGAVDCLDQVAFAIAMEPLAMDRRVMAARAALSLAFPVMPSDWRTARVEHLARQLSRPVLSRDPLSPLFAFSQAEFARRFMPTLQSRVFLEALAGAARVGRAMARQGFHALAWGVKYGEQYDLTSPSKWDRVLFSESRPTPGKAQAEKERLRGLGLWVFVRTVGLAARGLAMSGERGSRAMTGNLLTNPNVSKASSKLRKSRVGRKTGGADRRSSQTVTTTFAGNEYHGIVKTSSLGQRYFEGQDCRYTWTSGVKYEGPFVSSRAEGQGKLSWPDGSTYSGEVVNGLRNGHGEYTASDGVTKYVGQWRDGKRHGRGRLTYDPEGEAHYDGAWEDGQKHGFGCQVWPSGNRFEGQWKCGKMSGRGTMVWVDGGVVEKFVGYWEDGHPHGEGTQTWCAPEGSGALSSRAGVLPAQQMLNRYEGQWSNGLRNGKGLFCYANGARYAGEWADNVKQGTGRYTHEDGRVYAGPFAGDQMVNGGVPQSAQPSKGALNIGAEDNPVRRCIDVSDLAPFCLPADVGELDLSVGSGYDEADEVLREVYNLLLRRLGLLKALYHDYRMVQQKTGDDPFVLQARQMWALVCDMGLVAPGCSLSVLNRAVFCGPRHHLEAAFDDMEDVKPLEPDFEGEPLTPRAPSVEPADADGEGDAEGGDAEDESAYDDGEGSESQSQATAVVPRSGDGDGGGQRAPATVASVRIRRNWKSKEKEEAGEKQEKEDVEQEDERDKK